MPPTPTTVRRWELSRANCSMAGASSWQVAQKGDQNQNSKGFSPFTTDRRLTVSPVAASNISMSGTSSEISTVVGASVVVVVGAWVVEVVVVDASVVVVVGAWVVEVVVVDASVVVVVGAWVVEVVVVGASVVVELSTVVVGVLSGTVVGAVSPDGSSWAATSSATVVPVPVAVGRVVDVGPVVVVLSTALISVVVTARVVSGGSVADVDVASPHAARSRAAATAVPANRRINRVSRWWVGSILPDTSIRGLIVGPSAGKSSTAFDGEGESSPVGHSVVRIHGFSPPRARGYTYSRATEGGGCSSERRRCGAGGEVYPILRPHR